MIIEFLGNTGSGKSTLIPVLLECLRADGRTAMSVTEAIHTYARKTWWGRVICCFVPQTWQGPVLWRVFGFFFSKVHIVRFSIRYPGLVRFVIRSQLERSIPWKHRHLILSMFFRMLGQYAFLTFWAYQRDILVIDEGFVHRAVHLFVSESERIEPARVIDYLELLPQSDVIVWVETPLDVCLERVYARGLQVRLRRLQSCQVSQFMENAEQVIDVAARYLQSAGRQVVRITNQGDLNLSRAELQEKIVLPLSRPVAD